MTSEKKPMRAQNFRPQDSGGGKERGKRNEQKRENRVSHSTTS